MHYTAFLSENKEFDLNYLGDTESWVCEDQLLDNDSLGNVKMAPTLNDPSVLCFLYDHDCFS